MRCDLSQHHALAGQVPVLRYIFTCFVSQYITTLKFVLLMFFSVLYGPVEKVGVPRDSSKSGARDEGNPPSL